jgi:dipeptidyl aminopeptidase/acylaminoacyl peptidase
MLWTPLVTAAAVLAGSHGSAFLPPDCMRAVPAGTHNGQMVVGKRGKSGLWLATASGKVTRRLTSGHDSEASFSPNGRKIVFQRFTRRNRWSIVTRELSSGRTREIFTAAQGDDAQAPLWSSDGRWIAFLHQVDKGSTFPTHIVLMRPNGKGPHEVWKVSNLTSIPTLAWSRNGRCMAYQWGEFGSGAVAIRDADDFNQGVNLVPFEVVMPDGAKIFVPESAAFSADGRRLFVTYPISTGGKSAGDRTYSIAMDRPAPPRAVVDQGGYPLPSPDGRSLAYLSLDDGWTHVRRLSGSPRDRRLFNGVAWDWARAPR